MGATWKFFSGEDDAALPAPKPQREYRTSMWGILTGTHNDDENVSNMATAHHEAGHARAGAAAGLKITEMAAFPDGSGWTEWTGRGSIRDRLIAILAGQEAEISYLRNRCHISRTEALRATAAGAANDMANFRHESAGTGYTEAEIRDAARRFVRRHAYTIETNAKPLARRGRRGGTWA